MGVYAQETYVNRDEGYRFGESDVYETFADTAGELFRSCQEFGRCESSVYIDGPDGKPRRVGWVFAKLDRYEDTGERYVREVWVTVHDAPPEVSTTYHYADAGSSSLGFLLLALVPAVFVALLVAFVAHLAGAVTSV